jgi:ATP-dependent Clp protease ATP-binding subunit ClpC
MSVVREPELVALRKLAEDLAVRRGERLSTCHLLASIASRPSGASDLLADKRLSTEVLLKAARVLTDDEKDAVARAVQRAREFASRAGGSNPTPVAIHLLYALCVDRQTAAHRAIEQCGMDVGKLRNSAMQQAMGVMPPRRQVEVRRPSAGPAMPGTPSASPMTTRPSSPPSTGSSNAARVPMPPPKPATPKPQAPHHAPSAAPPVTNLATARPKKKGQPQAHPQGRFALDAKKYALLNQLGKNLTLAASLGELDPVVGRDEEIERTLDVLAKRRANNPCLIGAAGVGKTSVVRGIALRIAAGEDVASLDDRIVIELEAGALLAGTGMRGQLAERLAMIKEEVKRSEGRIVLFFDEIHTLFGSDAGDEAASELKIALAKGELACIGATTTEEYKKVIEADAALARRFSPVEVCELSPEESVLALEQVAPLLGAHHKALYTEQAIVACVQWSVRYIPGRALPDKAVSLLDLAGARARRRSKTEVDAEDVAEVVAEEAGVPIERLLESDGERMLRLEGMMAERIVGHTASLGRVATILRRNASGFRSRRPIGTFLLLGPTGVGKTETAKAIAECLFHSPDAMTRLDMSEYAEPHAIARLVGAPPGYVGHEAGGQLTEAVRRRPYQVILLDEIEKAHRDVLEAFLQVFDEGRLTDGRGRTIDFTSTVIILTSNIGSDLAPASQKGRIGFGVRRTVTERNVEYETAVVAAARSALPPELYNRLDEVLAFPPLSRDDVAEVARRMLVGLGTELEALRGVRLDVSEAAIEALLDGGGFDAELGARPMRRAIARMVEAPIAELILRGELTRGDVATVDVEDGKVVVDAVTPRAQTA